MIHKAKKSLGQNFLKSELALKKIIEAGEIKPTDIILEIGPGKGALTEKLLEDAKLVIAVEKDRELFEFLKIKFEKEIEKNPPSHKATDRRGKLILLNEDILEFSITETNQKFLNDLAGVGNPENRGPEKISGLLQYKIIANIPYNITGAILKKFLTEKHQPELMVLMVQHEVAKRIMGKNPTSPRLRRAKESILSISVKAYGEPKMIMKVDKRYFSPAPKVDSAIILIKNISRKNFFNSPLEGYSALKAEGGEESTSSRKRATPQEGNNFETRFWEIVKAGFAHKRKKLSSNLKNSSYGGNASVVESLGNKRAEDLTLTDWIALAQK